jgi:hypothetical protein
VLDSVGVIQARFFEELLKVVLKRSCLVLAVTHGLCGMIGTGAIRSLIDAAVAVGCGLLVALIAPLLAGLGALLSTLDCYTERCFPAADHGWLKSCRLGTDGVMGGDAMPSFGGVLLGASINAWRGHKNALSFVQRLVIPESVLLGLYQDLLHPLGLSQRGFRMCCSCHTLT